MVFKYENHNLLVQTQFMQLIQVTIKKNPVAVFYGPSVFAIPIHEKKYKVQKRIRKSYKWFSNEKTMSDLLIQTHCTQTKFIQTLFNA